MFEQTFVQSQAQTRKPWTVVVSLSLQCGGVALVLLYPLLHPEKMRLEIPKARIVPTWVNLQPVPVATTQTASATRSTIHAPRQLFSMPTNSPAAPIRGVDIP